MSGQSLAPSRRQALALGAALVAVPTGAVALPAPDPIFARIARHKQLMEPVRACPAVTEDDEERLAVLVRAADHGYAEMLATAPTSVAGLYALVSYVEGSGQGGVRRDLPLGTQETEDGVTYEDLFLAALRRSLAQLCGEART